MRLRSRHSLLAVVTWSLAVASAAAQPKPKPQRDLVTRDELLASNQRDESLYLALRNLRPRFLQPPPGVRSLGNARQIPTAVVVDGKMMGGLDALETIVSSTVEEVRYLEPSRAGTEYGSVAGGGAVVVKLWNPARHPPAKDTTPTA